MADGSHRIAAESKGRNVLIKGQYAVQELRAIPVQQSGNGLYDRPADVFNGVLDAEGRAGVNIQLPVATGAPGMLNATLTTRVFEPGGDASIYSQTVPFSPFTSYVGINLNQPKGKYIETDKDHVFDIVTVNDQGQPVNRSNLEYKSTGSAGAGGGKTVKSLSEPTSTTVPSLPLPVVTCRPQEEKPPSSSASIIRIGDAIWCT